MSLLSLTLLACAPPDEAPPPPPEVVATATSADTASASTVPPYELVHLDPEGDFSIPAPSPHPQFGAALAVGCDLDKDGVQEWAVSTPHDVNIDPARAQVDVYEDREHLATFTVLPREGAGASQHMRFLAAGGDTDGDGFGDLVFAEQWAGFGTYVRLVRSTDPADDVLLMATPEKNWVPLWLDFQEVGGTTYVLAYFTVGGAWRVDRFDLTGVGPGTTVQADDSTLWLHDDVPDGLRDAQLSAVDMDGDGDDDVLYGRVPIEDEAAVQYFCGPAPAGTWPGDCSPLAAVDAGIVHGAGDVDGDGAVDVVSTAHAGAGQDGEVWVLSSKGEVMAHLQGTRGAYLGASPQVLQDDQGASWVFVAEADIYSPQPTRAYAFHGRTLTGERVDSDAAVAWETGGRSIGWQTRGYRATADAPLQLILTEPYHDQGYVYLLPWP